MEHDDKPEPPPAGPAPVRAWVESLQLAVFLAVVVALAMIAKGEWAG